MTFKIGGKYNWKCEPTRLVYLGRNWSGNGYWNQFAKVETPTEVWCEVLDRDLHMLEETKEPDNARRNVAIAGGTGLVRMMVAAEPEARPVNLIGNVRLKERTTPPEVQRAAEEAAKAKRQRRAERNLRLTPHAQQPCNQRINF